MQIKEVEKFKIQYLFLEKKETNLLPINFVATVTARSAFYLIIKYLQFKKMIGSKNDQILFPQWICTSMTQTARKYLSPTVNPKANVKFIMAYHQYGFPQNMNEILDYCDRKKLILLEDCANHLLGKFENKDLGTFGLAGIYSTSKVFPVLWGGGLSTVDEELFYFAKSIQKDLNETWISKFLMLCRFGLDRNWEEYLPVLSDLNLMLYGVAEHAQLYPKRMQNIINYELDSGRYEQRRQNYLNIKKCFSNYDFFYGLEDSDVYPYVLPLIADDRILNNVLNLFRENGISSGIYNFDVNRNIFNPHFKKCLWVPIHQGVEDNIDWIVSLIRKGID